MDASGQPPALRANLTGAASSDSARFKPGTPDAAPHRAATSASAAMSPHAPASPLIGRLAELSTLESHLDAAMGGSTRLMLIAGDAGIGKTRVLMEMADRARRRGMIAVAGRWHRGEGADPMWPWAEALRELVEDLGPSAALADLGAGASVVATAVPAVAEMLPDLPVPPRRSPSSARFRLFNAIGGFLHRAAARQPILLSLEDLHWADPPSLLLLEFIAEAQRASAMCVVCTYRDIEVRAGDPLVRTLAELSRSPAVHRMTLGGLSSSEVSAYVEQLIGTTPAPPLLRTLVERTDGNPFFVGEVVRLLARKGGLEGAPAREPGVPRVPDEVRVVIDQRLSRLSAAAQPTLSAAAAIGREFDLDLLDSISRVHGDELLAVLEECVDERIIVPLPRGRYSFAHELVRERLYERLPVSARARVHGAIAKALVTARTAGIPISAAPLAHHFVQAALPGGDEAMRLAIVYSLSAAWEATEQLAFEDAVFHHGMALRLAIRSGWGEPAQARLFLALAEAQSRAGDVALARASFTGITRLARRMRDPELLARAALGYRGAVGTAFRFAPPDKDYVGLLEEALFMLGSSEDSATRVGLLARLGMELYFTPDPDRRRTLSDQAVAMARRLAEPHVLAETLVARYITLWSPRNDTEQLAGGREAIRRSLELADRELELQARYWLAVDLLELGDFPALDAELAAVQRLAGELNQPVYTWWARMRLAMRTLLDGHFDDAERLADEALPLGVAAKEANALQAHAAQIMLVRWEQGRVGELATVAVEYGRRFPHSRVWQSARAFIAAFSADAVAARAMLTRAVADDCASIPHDFLWLPTVALLAEVAVELDDAEAAARLHCVLAPYGDRWVTFGPAAACYGPVARLLGLLDMTCGNWPRAECQLEQAHEAALRAGSRSWIIHARAGQALVMLRRGSGETSRGQHLARSTREAALTLGMVRLAAQLDNLIGGAAAMGTRLTRREREVLELALDGASAKEIATHLVISERTAESHVASIYRKLDVRSRAGLRDRARALREPS